MGGIDFKGKPYAGVIEIGYALVPSARGHGLAAEATASLIELARTRQLVRVVAATTRDNIASQRTLEHTGFTCAETEPIENDERHYAIQLQADPT